MGALYKKEMKILFTGVMGFVIIAFLFLLVGIYMKAYNLDGYYPNFEYVFGSATFVYLIIIPLLTMRSFAEEKRQKTDQLLFTSPIGLGKVVLAKFLSMATLLGIPIAAFLFYPAILSSFGTVNYASAFFGIIAFYLLGLALIAVGIFISTLTESQIISAVISFAVMFLLYFMNGIISLIRDSSTAGIIAFSALVLAIAMFVRHMTKNNLIAAITGGVLEAALLTLYFLSKSALEGALTGLLSVFTPFDRLGEIVTQGLFNLNTILYYFSAMAVFLFLAVRALEKRRWS